MKRIKTINGYAVFQSASTRDEKRYGIPVGVFAIYFASDIKDYGITQSYPEWDDVETLEEAENLCNGNNYAIANEIAESESTFPTYAEIAEIESQLDAGKTREEVEEERQRIDNDEREVNHMTQTHPDTYRS